MSTLDSNNSSHIGATLSANIASRLPADIEKHIANNNNPHNVTCEQINAMPYDSNIVSDSNYIHTDNNFDNDSKAKLEEAYRKTQDTSEMTNIKNQLNEINTFAENNKNNIDNINVRIDNISSDINNINTSIDNNIANSQINSQQISEIQTILTTKANSVDIEPKMNLILNQEFIINQRASTTYEAGNRLYTVDRWIKDADVSVTVQSNGITISNESTTDYEGIGQYINNFKPLLGKSATFTIMANGNIYSLTADIPSNPKSTHQNTLIKSITTDFGKLEIEFQTNHLFVHILIPPVANSTTSTLELTWAKLEVGNTFTGVILGDIDRETTECRKYYQYIYSNYSYAPGYAMLFKASSTYYVYVSLPEAMRISPSVIDKNTNKAIPVIVHGKQVTKSYTATNFNLKHADNRTFTISYSLAENNTEYIGTNSQLCVWIWARIMHLAFDAEIYN